MTIKRGTLYMGAFLLAAGGVTLAVAANLLDRTAVAGTVTALWPIAIIAVGAGLVLRRSPVALAAGTAAAVLPGIALGASMVAVPDLAIACDATDRSPVTPAETREGTFGSAAAVDLELACGELTVTTQAGNGWRVDAADGADRRTEITADAGRLTAESRGSGRRWSIGAGRVEWDAVLPTGTTIDLSTRVDAGRGRLTLDGASLGRLDLEVNAGDVRATLAGATLDRLEAEVNAGSARIALPLDSFSADLAANAGSIELCVPDALALRVRSSAALGSVDTAGLVKVGDAWETPDFATATHQAELAVEASVGSVTLNPKGGCQ